MAKRDALIARLHESRQAMPLTFRANLMLGPSQVVLGWQATVEALTDLPQFTFAKPRNRR